jgi:hypothetical protein
LLQAVPPTTTQIRRLVLVRGLYETGLELSRSRGLGAGLALLNFHDAAEMLLQLLCEHLDVPGKSREFAAYWPALEEKGLVLGGRRDMARLNAARVNLKHRGLLPATFELEGFRAATTNLLNGACQAAFERPLSEISLTSLVPDQGAREALERAEIALQGGDHKTALGEVAVTFVLLLQRHSRRAYNSTGMPRQYSLSDAALNGYGWSDASGLADHFDDFDRFKARKAFDAISNSAEVFSEALTVIGYGLDFRSYLRLKSHMPVVHVAIGGNTSIAWTKSPPSDPEIVRECIEFVVDTALRVGFESHEARARRRTSRMTEAA